jgi:polynucleotide 5'-kinase involved in rRNA processing
MLSFDSENKKPIMVIKDGNNKIIQDVFLYDKINKSFDGFKELELDEKHHFQLIPNKNAERDVLYIAGQSGSGKSYFAKMYIKEMVEKQFKGSYIFVLVFK